MKPVRAASRGQSTMEYAIFIAVVVAAAASMSLYVRRAFLANIRVLEQHANVGPMQ